MGVFARMSAGWDLGMRCLKVVMADKTLMLFPVFSGAASLLLIVGFIFGIGPEELGALLREAEQASTIEEVPPTLYILAFSIYFLLYFITIYFNVALIGAARMSMDGKDTSPADGLGVANNHLPQILVWSLLSGSVGLLLGVLENNDKIGRFVAAILGTAWTVLTYFVVPVMVFEDRGPVSAIGRSTSLMKQTWGENLAAQFGIGLVTFAVSFAAVLVTILIGVLIPDAAPVLAVLVGLILVLAALLATTAKSVLTVGLFVYATEGKAPGSFDDGAMRAAFGDRPS